MVINKKIKRTMMGNKSQYIGSLLLIIISCILYTMFNQLTSNLINISSSFEKNYIQEDANFIADKKIINIQELQSKFNMIIEETGTFDYPVSEGKTLRIFTKNTKVNIPAIIEGKGLKTGGILIDPAYAKANKIKIGDNIKIYNENLNVSGFMSLPNYIYPLKSESDLMNNPKDFGIAVISREDFNRAGKGSSFYSIKFINDGNSVEKRTADFKDYLRSQNIVILKWTNVNENPRVTYLTAKIDSVNKVSSSMPVAILVLTCILTGVVMWRMLKREAVVIGTLYALGYRKKEIMKHYLMYPLSIALVGGIIGTILGALMLKPMLNLMLMYFNMPIVSESFSMKYASISILLPVIFLIICGYFVVIRALKFSPVDLIRGGREKYKVSFIEKRLKLEKLKFKTKFKIREQLRSIPRSIFLLLGVVLSTMLLLLGFAEKSSIDFLIKNTYDEAYKYQYEYLFNSLQQGKTAVGDPFSIAAFKLKSDNTLSYAVYGISPDSKYLYLKDKSGSKLRFDNVIITRPMADRLKVKPQDTIELVNKLDSREYSITIGSIAETYIGEYIFMPLKEFNNMLKYPEQSYMGLWSKDKLDVPESKLLSTKTIQDYKSAFDAVTQPMQYTIGTIAVISFIIGLIVMYVVTSLIIEENKESISLMKVLGYRKKEVYSLILNSSVYMVVLGYIIGVPMLLLSLSALFKSVSRSMNFIFPVRISYSYVFLGFVVIYLTYEISKALSKKKINRISMNEILKTVSE
jgi:putative ABC transport system permease protein